MFNQCCHFHRRENMLKLLLGKHLKIILFIFMAVWSAFCGTFWFRFSAIETQRADALFPQRNRNAFWFAEYVYTYNFQIGWASKGNFGRVYVLKANKSRYWQMLLKKLGVLGMKCGGGFVKRLFFGGPVAKVFPKNSVIPQPNYGRWPYSPTIHTNNFHRVIPISHTPFFRAAIFTFANANYTNKLSWVNDDDNAFS